MEEIILIKLGGSIITQKDKEYTFNKKVVERLAREIKKANVPVVIAHGSGSFGHTSAKKYGGMKGYKSKWGIAKVSYDAMEINSLVMEVLINEKISAISLRPMSMIVADKGKVKKTMFDPIIEVLKQGLIPIIYGDVIIDKTFKTTIFSGEKTLSLIAKFLQKNKIVIKKIIEVGLTDGVLDLDGNSIGLVTENNLPSVKKSLYKTKNDITGGMEHKIEEAIKIAKNRVITYIINGSKPDELYNTLVGKKIKGTIIR